MNSPDGDMSVPEWYLRDPDGIIRRLVNQAEAEQVQLSHPLAVFHPRTCGPSLIQYLQWVEARPN